MTHQNTARIAHPAWTTVAKRNTLRPQQHKPRIDPQVANQLTRNWTQKNKRDQHYPLNPQGHKYPFSSKNGETWADEVEREEEAGWVSGWPSNTQPKRRVQPSSWAAAAKCVVH